MTPTSTDFAQMVSSFLTDYLPLQRGYSRNTILSYRDALKLLVRFLTEVKGIQIARFAMKDFSREIVLEYLDWIRGRGDSIATANQRLAAIKTFAEYTSLECIEYIAPLQAVQHLKSTKSVSREITYLSVEQMSLLINRPDINSRTGLRHRVVLTLLYDSGCRVQELCDIQMRDVYVGTNATVRLHGKGNKYRTVTISSNTASLLGEYMKRQRKTATTDQPLILNRNNCKMTRAGVNYIINKYVQEIRLTDNSFPEHIHAHCFRHSKAMHMLAAGINLVYIRDFLGHEDISTTMIYSRADNRLKTEAINKLAPKVTEEVDLPDWTKDQDLMTFLNSLK